MKIKIESVAHEDNKSYRTYWREYVPDSDFNINSTPHGNFITKTRFAGVEAAIEEAQSYVRVAEDYGKKTWTVDVDLHNALFIGESDAM